MADFKSFYDNEIYPILKDSGILSEWRNDYNKYNIFYKKIEKYFSIFTVFCILLFVIFYTIVWNFQDWKMCHPVIYYSVGIMSAFGIPFGWTLSLSTKRYFAKQKKEREKYYKNKLKKLGIYKKILQNLSCDGDYFNKQFPPSLYKTSKLLKSLEKIVSIDDCITGNYENTEFSVYDCVCLLTNYSPRGGAISYDIHNLIINFKNKNNLPNALITKENVNKFNNMDFFNSLFLKYPNNDIKIEIIENEILVCLHNDRDYFEFCDLSNDEIINYENLIMLSGDIQNILRLINAFVKINT